MLELNDRWGKHQVVLVVTRYYNDNLCIKLLEDDGECRVPYANLTTNFPIKLISDEAFIDTNNLPDAVSFIFENSLGYYNNRSIQSGYCIYPIFKFDMEELERNSE